MIKERLQAFQYKINICMQEAIYVINNVKKAYIKNCVNNIYKILLIK